MSDSKSLVASSGWKAARAPTSEASLREALELALEAGLDDGVLAEELAKGLALGRRGEFAVDDEVGGLDVFGMGGELVDGVAAVAEDAAVAIEERHLALARARVAVALVVEDVAGFLAEVAGVDGVFAFGADHHGEGECAAIDLEQGSFGVHGRERAPKRRAGKAKPPLCRRRDG